MRLKVNLRFGGSHWPSVRQAKQKIRVGACDWVVGLGFWVNHWVNRDKFTHLFTQMPNFTLGYSYDGHADRVKSAEMLELDSMIDLLFPKPWRQKTRVDDTALSRTELKLWSTQPTAWTCISIHCCHPCFAPIWNWQRGSSVFEGQSWQFVSVPFSWDWENLATKGRIWEVLSRSRGFNIDVRSCTSASPTFQFWLFLFRLCFNTGTPHDIGGNDIVVFKLGNFSIGTRTMVSHGCISTSADIAEQEQPLEQTAASSNSVEHELKVSLTSPQDSDVHNDVPENTNVTPSATVHGEIHRTIYPGYRFVQCIRYCSTILCRRIFTTILSRISTRSFQRNAFALLFLISGAIPAAVRGTYSVLFTNHLLICNFLFYLPLPWFRTRDETAILSVTANSFKLQRSGFSTNYSFPLDHVSHFSAEKLPTPTKFIPVAMEERPVNPYYIVAHTTGDPFSFGGGCQSYENTVTRLNDYLAYWRDHDQLALPCMPLSDGSNCSNCFPREHCVVVELPHGSRLGFAPVADGFIIWKGRAFPVRTCLHVMAMLCLWFGFLHMSISFRENERTWSQVIRNGYVIFGICFHIFAILVLILSEKWLELKWHFCRHPSSRTSKLLGALLRRDHIDVSSYRHVRTVSRHTNEHYFVEVFGGRVIKEVPGVQVYVSLVGENAPNLTLWALSEGECVWIIDKLVSEFPHFVADSHEHDCSTRGIIDV